MCGYEDGTLLYYWFQDADGRWDGYSTFDADEAQRYAEENGLRLFAEAYTLRTTELVADFTAAAAAD